MTATGQPTQSLPMPKTGRLPSSEETQGTAFEGPTKVAILMVSLGKEASSHLLRHLSEDEVETVSREVARLGAISGKQAAGVLEEFERSCLAQNYILKGGVDYAKTMLTSAFGGDSARSIVDRLMKSMDTEAGDLAALQKCDPSQLAKLIYNEHPQVIALILSHLTPAQSSALLMALPPESRSQVVKRMAQLDQFSPETLDRIATFIGRRLKTLGEFSREAYGGVRAVAEMLNRLETQVSDELLSSIGDENEALSLDIRRLMFVFEDILKLAREDVKTLLTNIDTKDLMVALKGAAKETVEHFTQCMSNRAAAMLAEDISSLGPVKIKDVEAAQHRVIETVRKLQSDGAIGSQGSGDKYVT